MKKILIALITGLLILNLTGCKKKRRIIREQNPETRKVLEDETKKAKPALEVPQKAPIKLESVKWIVITEKNAEEVFGKIKEKEVPVLFALRGGDYEVLAINTKTLLQYIAYQKKVIIMYQDHYESKSKSDLTSDTN
jgi:hypothetical protein